MFFRGICYGCTAVCSVCAIYFLVHPNGGVPAALLGAVALWNYFLGGKKK